MNQFLPPIFVSCLAAMLACGGERAETASDTGAAPDDTGAQEQDVVADDTAPDLQPVEDADVAACLSIAVGEWSAAGACVGMRMTAELEMDDGDCSFTLGEWNMAMSVPTGGTIVGDAVTFEGANWSACTGNLSSDGLSISASCPADGGAPSCTFTMTAE